MENCEYVIDAESPASVCSLEEFCYQTKTRTNTGPVKNSNEEQDLFCQDCDSSSRASLGEVNEDKEEVVEKRSQLTLEDCVDMDVDTLTSLLERKFQVLKSETLEFFVEARSRFKTRALNDLNQERMDADRKLQFKVEEIHLLSTELKDERQRTKRLLSSVTRFSDSVALANYRKRTHRLMLTVFQSWYQFAKAERSLKRNMQRALRYYCTEHQKRRVLIGWMGYIRSQNRLCSQERLQTKLTLARKEVEAKFNEKYALLEEENRLLKEKVKSESDARSKLEEDMQQAFMRGVCALNMEALSVLKRGMPPNGLNPFYKDSLQNKDLTMETEENSAPTESNREEF
eukprot:g1378.t1